MKVEQSSERSTIIIKKCILRLRDHSTLQDVATERQSSRYWCPVPSIPRETLHGFVPYRATSQVAEFNQMWPKHILHDNTRLYRRPNPGSPSLYPLSSNQNKPTRHGTLDTARSTSAIPTFQQPISDPSSTAQAVGSSPPDSLFLFLVSLRFFFFPTPVPVGSSSSSPSLSLPSKLAWC